MTQHNCNDGAEPFFGKKTPGCPRCDELLNGAPVRKLGWVERKKQRDEDARRRREFMRRHYESEAHRNETVCTAFDH